MIQLNCPGGHIPVETPEDVRRLIDETNDMHDAYLLSIHYRTHVRANHHVTASYCEGESLVLRYLVTSLLDLPIVELTFLGVSEWKAPDGVLFGIQTSFDTSFVTFFADSETPENAPTRVISRKMYWRIVDRPGLHLQRGGTRDAVWYVIPGLWLPMNENLEDYTQIVEELASTVEGAKLYHTDYRVQPLPCDDAAFTTDHIHSFRSEETVFAGEGSVFCWYELQGREDLKKCIETLDHGTSLNGNMIAVCDDDGVVFTVELIESGYFNMVICSSRGILQTHFFGGGKYHAEPYSGGGREELS